MDVALAEHLAGRRAQWSEVFCENSLELQAHFAGGDIRFLTQHSRGVAVRCLYEDGEHFASATVGTGDDAGEIARELSGGTTVGCEASLLAGALPVSPAEAAKRMCDLLRGFRDGVRVGGADRGRAAVRMRVRRYSVTNSAGEACEQETSQIHVFARAFKADAFGHAGLARSTISDLSEAEGTELGHKVAAQAVRLSTAVRPAHGLNGVVFTPVTAGILIHEVVGHGLEVDAAIAGSALWKQRGTLASHPGLHVRDDARLPEAWEHVTADEEGTTLSDAVLVADGEVTGVVTDRSGARRLGVPGSTGHGRRGGFIHRPVPRVRHTVVRAGQDDPGDIVRDTTDGVLIETLDSGEANVRDGTFTLRVLEAREIRRGRPGRPLTGFTLTGDLSDLRRMDAIGSDSTPHHALCGRGAHWLPVSGMAPTLRLPRVTVHSGAEGRRTG